MQSGQLNSLELEVLETTHNAGVPWKHCDLSVFPNDAVWFQLLESEVYKGEACIRLYRAACGNDIVLLPLIRTYSKWLRGIRLEAMQNYYTPDFRPICSTLEARRLITKLVAVLSDHEYAYRVSLKPLDLTAPEIELIHSALREAGWVVSLTVAFGNWVHVVSGGFQHYLATRSSRVRNTLRRKRSRLMSLGDVEIIVHCDAQDMSQFLQSYERVYRDSWKTPEPHPGFVPALIRYCAASGMLRLGVLSVDGVPVAVHFWIVASGVASIYKLAHSRAYDEYSPGTVLMAEMLRHVIDDDGVTLIDFLSGDDAYKSDWMSERREKVELVAYRTRSLRGRAAYLHECHLRPAASRCLSLGRLAIMTVLRR